MTKIRAMAIHACRMSRKSNFFKMSSSVLYYSGSTRPFDVFILPKLMNSRLPQGAENVVTSKLAKQKSEEYFT